LKAVRVLGFREVWEAVDFWDAGVLSRLALMLAVVLGIAWYDVAIIIAVAVAVEDGTAWEEVGHLIVVGCG
jgi:hypothetical protein